MAAARRVGFCLDEALGRDLASILRMIRAPGAPDIHDVRDLGLDNTSDEVVLAELGRRGLVALITRDSSMLSASIRRDAWRASGVSVFLCDGRWGNIRLFEQARLIIWQWPEIVEQASAGPQGGAWRIPLDPRHDGFQRIFAELPG